MKPCLNELVIDNFAGGGGATTGIEIVLGRPVDVAINHDPLAIAMHKANHPNTKHFCESVWDIDPRKVAAGRPVGLVWLSPDCKHFSKAKGGKPVDKNIRGLAWVAVRWAATVKPRVIILENVEEFKTWGPLLENGKPDPAQKGRTFNCFVNALKRQGYAVETRELRACDYGAPTIRKRLFLIARRDGQPIVWPAPTHGDPKSAAVKNGSLKPWRTAAEIIDWSLPCPSMFERKRPLAENTMRRIARGIMKFVVDNPDPFIVKFQQNSTGQNVDEPIHTVMAGATRFGLVTPTITSIGQTGNKDRTAGVNDPLRTVVSKAEQCLITPTLIQYHQEHHGNEHRGQHVEDPLMTLDVSNRYGLVSAFLSKHYGGNYEGAGSSLDEGLHTVTGKDHNALVTAHISRQFGKSIGHAAGAPVGSVTAGGGGKTQLVTSHILKLKGTNLGHPAAEPLQTITSGGLHFGEVRAFLLKYYGTGEGQKINEPIGTVTTKDRFGLVTIQGEDYAIVDIGMRMLEPRELFNAQGFPEDYIIDRDTEGKPISKASQVARCGNAVPPPFAEALVRANLPEMCCAGQPLYKQGEI